MNKAALLAQIRAEKVIGLVRADLGDDLVACADALARGGLNCLEIALTTPAGIATLRAASEARPDFRFGLGTVLDVETARLGIHAGAQFIVTPSPRPEVILLCRRFHVPVISGAFTREDIIVGHRGGADAIKVFPGAQFGPEYIRTLKSELPEIPMIPIGGVTPETIAEFLRAGAIAGFAGASLMSVSHVEARHWPAITEEARRFVQNVAPVAG